MDGKRRFCIRFTKQFPGSVYVSLFFQADDFPDKVDSCVTGSEPVFPFAVVFDFERRLYRFTVLGPFCYLII